MFDLIIFDEAHHQPAQAWSAILDAIPSRAVLLTATPTRRDGKPLRGEIIYAYPLSRAIADGVYAPISFVSVECPEGADPDRALAAAAAERLRQPTHRDAGSRLLVRAGSQAEARALIPIYEEVGLRIGEVLADTAQTAVRRLIGQVRDGEMHGFVSVGALIEGFDFPSLKVATYHRPHRSLAPTIQFVGRLSRATPSNVRGELLAIPSQVEGETRELYVQDRDWAELMPEIIDAAQITERRIRNYVAAATVTGPLDVPPRALQPPRSARIYRLPMGIAPGLDVDPSRLGRADVTFRFYDAFTNLIAFVTHRIVGQRWAETPLLEVSEFALHVATWVEESRALFVSTESPYALDELLKLFGVAEEARHLSADDLVRLVYAANPGTYFSIGLRATSARRARGASYDMTAGPAVQTALDYADEAHSMLGHLMAKPHDGGRGTLGFSMAKSKLWEPENTRSLLEFRDWAVERAHELDRPAAGTSLPHLNVRLGERFEAFTDEIVGVSLDPSLVVGSLVLYRQGQAVLTGDIEVQARRVASTEVKLAILVLGEVVWRGEQSPTGHINELANDSVEFLEVSTGELIAVARGLRDSPSTLYLADGSTIAGDTRLPQRESIGPLPAKMLASDPWDHIDITKEIGLTGSVQARTKELAAADAEIVVTDHGSGELADFISLQRVDGGIRLKVYHCKGAHGPAPGRRVIDLYDVMGQVTKSLTWTVARAQLRRELLRRFADRNAFQVVHGTSELFGKIVDELTPSTVAEIEIIAVQPGVSVSDVPGWRAGAALLHAAYGWCRSEETTFRLLASP
jgi:hypothetical protein